VATIAVLAATFTHLSRADGTRGGAVA
jgi:hypothetical protein